MKIVFIVENIFTKRDYIRFGMEYFHYHGYDVEIWLITEGYKATYGEDRDYREANLYELNFKEYKNKVKNSNADFFVYYSRFIDKYGLCLLKYDKKIILMRGMGAAPMYPLKVIQETKKKTRIERIIERPEKLILSKMYGYCIDYCEYISRRLVHKKIQKMISSKLITAILPTKYYKDEIIDYISEKSHVIYAHALNFDKVIEFNRKGLVTKEEYIMFCDSGFYENDYTDMNGSAVGKDIELRGEYYSDLEKLFKKLEAYYNMPVLIAGHPHVKYGKDAFCGREIILGSTHEIMMKAKLVLMNFSTFINFAIYYKKPLLLINSRRFIGYIIGNIEVYEMVKDCAENTYNGVGYLELENYNDDDWRAIPGFPDEKRQKVITDLYIDNDSHDKTVPEIIEDVILERI